MLRYIPINKDLAVCKLFVQHESKIVNRPKSLIYALDISGSMAGKPIENAKAGLIAALKNQIDNFNEINVIVYNHIALRKNVDKVNLETIIHNINSLQANGCTNFSEMFNGLITIVREQTNKYKGNVDIYVYIFSDGKHYDAIPQPWLYYGQPTPEQYAAFTKAHKSSEEKMLITRYQFYEAMKNKTIINAGGRTFCKVRAFSNDVDIPMMEYLTHCGNNDGDFLYAFTPQEIIEILSVDELLNTNTLSGVLMLNNSVKTNLNFTLVDDSLSNDVLTNNLNNLDNMNTELISNLNNTSKKNLYKDQCITNITLLINQKPSLLLDGKTIDLNPELVIEDNSNSSEIFEAFLYYFATTMKLLADKLIQSGSDKQSLNNNVVKFKELDTEMTSFYESKYQLLKSRLARKKYNGLYNQLRQELSTITANAVVLVRGNAPEALARILHAGHQANKKGLQNRLNSLALAGAAKLEEAERQLIELANKQNKDEITKTLDQCRLACMISLSNTVDATLDQDVMCLTGFMSRPEAAIGSSDQIRIQNINSLDNAILWSVFCDELLSKLSTMSYDDKAKMVHGGFDIKKKADSSNGVMSNAYRSALNFAYPLYINKYHWEVAKYYLPQIVAWMATLDFAAQSFEQIKNVPFVLVGSAILDLMQKPSEANIQAFLNVARVAKQIVVDYNLKHINEDYINWISGYEGRVPKSISSIFVFLTKLLFVTTDARLDNSLNSSSDSTLDNSLNNSNLNSNLNPSLKLDDTFWQSVFEEQSRRMMQKLSLKSTPLISDAFVAEQCNYREYLQINKANHIDELKYARLADPNAIVHAKEGYKPPLFDNNNVVMNNKNIDQLLNKFSDKYQNYHHMIMQMKKFYQYMQKININHLFDDFDKNLGVINQDVCNYFSDLVNDYKQQNPDEKTKYTIDSLCIDYNLTKEHIYATLVINQRHCDNSIRAESKLQPICTRDSIALIKAEVERSIQLEQTKQNNAIQNTYNQKLAELFLSTDDLNVAQGIIISDCHNIGSPLFHLLLIKLEELTHSPYRMEKILMIVNGKHNNKQLYREGYVYPANKRNRGRIIYAYNWDRNKQGLDVPDAAYWNTVFKYNTNKLNL